MADSNLFKPQTSSSGIGKKAMNKGQFANPPAYVDVSGFTGPSKIQSEDGTTLKLESSPSSRRGRV